MDFYSTIPSENLTLLNNIVGSMIVDLFRCSWDDFDSFDKDNLYNISQRDFFCKTSGAVVLVLDNGLEISFYSDDEIASVTMSIERNIGGVISNEYFRDDKDFFLINNSTVDYTTERVRNIKGERIVNIKILKRKPINAKYESLPNEVGVLFELSNSELIVFGHDVTLSSDSFSIAFYDEIDSFLLKEIELIKLSSVK